MGRETSAASTAEACSRCGGLGWMIDADGGNGAARPCDCQKRRNREPLLDHAGIPEHYRDCRLENFYTQKRTDSQVERSSLLQARRDSELYVDRFLDPGSGRFRATGLIYVGPPGTGKTHLATGVLVALIERYGVRGRFVNVSHLLYQIQATFDRDSVETKRQILEPITRAEILLLDELGAIKPSEWVQDILYLVINERYINDRPTIFTCNYRLAGVGGGRAQPSRQTRDHQRATAVSDAAAAQTLSRPSAGVAPSPGTGRGGWGGELLEERISPQVASRIYEMAQPILVGNRDYRQALMMPRRLQGR